MSKPDIYKTITDKILAQLATGVAPWQRPWRSGRHAAGAVSRPRRSCGTPYSGVNVLMLWIEAEEKGYTSPLWLTFNQARDLGGNVKKGAKSTTVVYANTFEKKTKLESGEDKTEKIPFLRAYCVFNSEQCENLPARFSDTVAEPTATLVERIDYAEAFFAATGGAVHTGGDRACYATKSDTIRMPKIETFVDSESYYSTLAHEFVHWTKHESRLNRNFESKRFGDEAYAIEELVAEIGAAFLCADLGLSSEPQADHASYIAAWIQAIKNDSKAIFTAASHATKAVDFLHAAQPAVVTDTEPQLT